MLLVLWCLFWPGVLATDLFGLSSSDTFTLNDVTVPDISSQLVDCWALSNDACLLYANRLDTTATSFNPFTGQLASPEVNSAVCALHSGRTLSWNPDQGLQVLGSTLTDTIRPHYGSLIVLNDNIAYLLHNSTRLIAIQTANPDQDLLVGNENPLLALFTDSISRLAYLALDLDSAQFYVGFPLDPSRSEIILPNLESIYLGGNALNSRPQILKPSPLSLLLPNSNGAAPTAVPLESALWLPLLTREPLVASQSQTLNQPVFTVPVIVGEGSSIQLNPYIQTHFQDLQIGPGAVLVLDLNGAAYDAGSTLNIFSYASVTGQFSQIILLNYASSSCLTLSADGEFTGTSFFVTFSVDVSCTYSSASRFAYYW